MHFRPIYNGRVLEESKNDLSRVIERWTVSGKFSLVLICLSIAWLLLYQVTFHLRLGAELPPEVI